MRTRMNMGRRKLIDHRTRHCVAGVLTYVCSLLSTSTSSSLLLLFFIRKCMSCCCASERHTHSPVSQSLQIMTTWKEGCEWRTPLEWWNIQFSTIHKYAASSVRQSECVFQTGPHSITTTYWMTILVFFSHVPNSNVVERFCFVQFNIWMRWDRTLTECPHIDNQLVNSELSTLSQLN